MVPDEGFLNDNCILIFNCISSADKQVLVNPLPFNPAFLNLTDVALSFLCCNRSFLFPQNALQRIIRQQPIK